MHLREQFDHDQLVWFEKTLKEDAEDRTIRTVIVGMHEALPDSISAGHSMNESATGTETGRRVYSDLVDFKKRSGKEVQVVSSHAHFLMSDVYKTSCHKPEDVLPGWIVEGLPARSGIVYRENTLQPLLPRRMYMDIFWAR